MVFFISVQVFMYNVFTLKLISYTLIYSVDVGYTHVVCCVSLTLTSSRCSDTCDVIGATDSDWEGRGATGFARIW